MQIKYIFCALIVIFLVCSPAAASTKKIASGAPVFIGETDLDISSAIRDCKVIAWWADEADMSGPATKNITIKRVNDVILPVNHFNISPDLFSGYPGNWYCEDKKPTFVVLNVHEPAISIRVWDLDRNEDISGKAVPVTTNITYRIDTNLHQALSYANRTELTPADGFMTVTLTNPVGKDMKNIYTGSVGSSSTQILIFDGTPFMTSPTYYGRNLEAWNRLSRDTTGGYLYPTGTYTFTVVQNLGGMKDSYISADTQSGRTTSSASVTFLPLESPATQTTTVPSETPVTTSPETIPPTTAVTKQAVTLPVTTIEEPPAKVTYSPLTAWAGILGLAGAGALLAQRRD
ncbi:DUF3821 domain-containing protein [Methanoregula formicica]|uniref:DUF3821 domain-containing protein n=1 Tax=Methanoregula formicica (strain DSM 22288 / NBRC 105244 / SMSP) TaxID=593750 RepID=L0HGE7_METFS|nr:DUF3821 domain-containing protein [Methanoregula formicica]AGB02393.1 hypothetical protein Metfor_1353 [Methanoregula formicica SMSP]